MSAAARGAAGALCRNRAVPPDNGQEQENQRHLAEAAAEALRLEREAKKEAKKAA